MTAKKRSKGAKSKTSINKVPPPSAVAAREKLEWHFLDTRDAGGVHSKHVLELAREQRSIETLADVEAFYATERGALVRQTQHSLSQLTDFEFMSAVWGEVSRRRVEPDPEAPLDITGLYEATFEALSALIGSSGFTPLAQNVAAVGRGERLSTRADTKRIREIWQELSLYNETILVNMTHEEFTQSYAAELLHRFRNEEYFQKLYPRATQAVENAPIDDAGDTREHPSVEPRSKVANRRWIKRTSAALNANRRFVEAIGAALKRDSLSGRVTDVVLACGIRKLGGRGATSRRKIQTDVTELCAGLPGAPPPQAPANKK